MSRKRRRRRRPGTHICLFCFAQSGPPDPVWPLCPHCDGEGIAVDVEPPEDFLKQHPREGIHAMLTDWNAASGVREAYKELKRERIEDVLAMLPRGRR